MVASTHELWWSRPSDDDSDADDTNTAPSSPLKQEKEAAPATLEEHHERDDTSATADDEPKLFTMWLKPFHFNFACVLSEYLQWQLHVDTAAMSSHFQDESCAEFGVQTMIPWRLRRLVRREDARIQRRLRQRQTWQDPMTSLPPPEPPPAWTFGWSWEAEVLHNCR